MQGFFKVFSLVRGLGVGVRGWGFVRCAGFRRRTWFTLYHCAHENSHRVTTRHHSGRHFRPTHHNESPLAADRTKSHQL